MFRQHLGLINDVFTPLQIYLQRWSFGWDPLRFVKAINKITFVLTEAFEQKIHQFLHLQNIYSCLHVSNKLKE